MKLIMLTRKTHSFPASVIALLVLLCISDLSLGADSIPDDSSCLVPVSGTPKCVNMIVKEARPVEIFQHSGLHAGKLLGVRLRWEATCSGVTVTFKPNEVEAEFTKGISTHQWFLWVRSASSSGAPRVTMKGGSSYQIPDLERQWGDGTLLLPGDTLVDLQSARQSMESDQLVNPMTPSIAEIAFYFAKQHDTLETVFFFRLGDTDGAELKSIYYAGQSSAYVSDKEMLHAIEQNDAKTAMDLLDRGADANVRNEKGLPILMIAAANGSERIVRALVDAGAAVDAAPHWGSTSLAIAAQRGHLPVVEYLLEKGADVSSRDVYDGTPLIGVSQTDHETAAHATIVSLLIKKGANPNALTDDGRTALTHAAVRGHVRIAAALLKGGADVDAGKSPYSPLMLASVSGYSEMAKLLLQEGADLNRRSIDGRKPIEFAVEGGHQDIINLLRNWR